MALGVGRISLLQLELFCLMHGAAEVNIFKLWRHLLISLLRCLGQQKILLFEFMEAEEFPVKDLLELLLHADELVLLAELLRQLTGVIALEDDDAAGAPLVDINIDEHLRLSGNDILDRMIFGLQVAGHHLFRRDAVRGLGLNEGGGGKLPADVRVDDRRLGVNLRPDLRK